MQQDRTYWRAQDDKRLIDEAKHYPSVELCIALAERLQDADAQGLAEQLEAAEYEIRYLKAEITALGLELREAQSEGADL